MRNSLRILVTVVAAFLPVIAQACGPNTLGTSRVLEIDPAKFRSIKGHEKSLGLRPMEVVLTFDDGPIAGKTPRILDTLKKECVKATFFYVGTMAKAYPKLVRRVVAHGHTLGHHTQNHNRLPRYSKKRASQLIDKGIRTLEKIAYGSSTGKPRTPFFRYPYLARTRGTDRLLAAKGLVAFGANVDSKDWKRVSANTVHNRIMRRLRQEGKGIVLMHDIQGRTAKMLPRLLKSLKSKGYKIVHLVPKGTTDVPEEPLLIASAEPNKNKAKETEATLERLAAKRAPKRPKKITSVVVLPSKTDKSVTKPKRWQPIQLASSRPIALIPSPAMKLSMANAAKQSAPNRDGVAIQKPVDVPQSTPQPVAQAKKAELAPSILAKMNQRQLKSVDNIASPDTLPTHAIQTVRSAERSVTAAKTKAAQRTRKLTRVTRNWKLRRSHWIIQ